MNLLTPCVNIIGFLMEIACEMMLCSTRFHQDHNMFSLPDIQHVHHGILLRDPSIVEVLYWSHMCENRNPLPVRRDSQP